jgi:glucose/arabinose dehydrogenase
VYIFGVSYLLGFVLLLVVAASASADVGLQKIGSFERPVYVTQAPGSKMMVLEQAGKIRVRSNSGWQTFLDISGRVSCCGEQGLLGLAFHPNYKKNRKFYVNYTNQAGNTRIVEFKRSKQSQFRALRRSARAVMGFSQPYANHNGGHLAFDRKKLLYIASGDGGSGGDPHNYAQNKKSLLGKILRINPIRKKSKPYTVPRSNPYVGRPGDRRVFSRGLRNPWRFSLEFRAKESRIIIGDVGQSSYEEIDYARLGKANGGNFGWSRFEGNSIYNAARQAPGHIPPIKTYQTGSGRCAVTGGYIIRRSQSKLNGRYIYGDFCSGQIRSLVPGLNGSKGDRSEGATVSQLSSFGQDLSGRVYAVSLAGSVYRIRD